MHDKKEKNRKYIPEEKNKSNAKFEKIKELEIVLNRKKKKQPKKNNNKYIPTNKNSSKKKKFIILGVVTLFIVFIVWRMFSFFSRYQYQKIDTDDLGINEEIFKSELDSIINIALLGVDKNNISDAILIASINPTKDIPTIKLISFARDTLVEVIPKNKKTYFTKINEAYGNGGEVTTLRTLNKNFGLNVKNFISIEMKGFATIIDNLGGVDNIEITKQEKDQINGIINTTKELKEISKNMVPKEGIVHLDGPQTVAFVRIRKTPTKDGNNDDFGRGDRQKEVLLKIFEKMKSIPKSKIFSLIEPSLKYLKTSIKLTGILKICKDFMGRKYKLEHISIPNRNIPINADFKIIRFGQETSTVFYDLKYSGRMINDFIYKDIMPDKFLEENKPPSSLNYSGINVVRSNGEFKNKTEHVDSKKKDWLYSGFNNKNSNVKNNENGVYKNKDSLKDILNSEILQKKLEEKKKKLEKEGTLEYYNKFKEKMKKQENSKNNKQENQKNNINNNLNNNIKNNPQKTDKYSKKENISSNSKNFDRINKPTLNTDTKANQNTLNKNKENLKKKTG